MCGIVGLYLKNRSLDSDLGTMLSDMLLQMTDRGPDSAGVAFYHDEVADGRVKITLQGADDVDWGKIKVAMLDGLASDVTLTPRANHAVLNAPCLDQQQSQRIVRWIADNLPGVRITSLGSSIEIYKEKGLPESVIRQYGLRGMAGTHALGHTRMATESAVTTEHSHPFSTGLDLCLVHNGSLSNHNQLREKLRRKGIEFQTDNDSEVAAGYLTWRLAEGDTLDEALHNAINDLDGFYTFAIGTRNGFAVLRDPIACKPAILAETDDWVAMSSEYRAIAQLPGSDSARIWEPEPATIYSWERD